MRDELGRSSNIVYFSVTAFILRGVSFLFDFLSEGCSQWWRAASRFEAKGRAGKDYIWAATQLTEEGFKKMIKKLGVITVTMTWKYPSWAFSNLQILSIQNISYAFYFRIFRTRRLPYENKMHTKNSKQVRESAAVSGCTKIPCVRKVEGLKDTKI